MITIDPAMIERIEVIHGANALQGLGASGGIINIITKRAPRKDGETFHDVSVSASVAVPREDDSAGYKAAYVFGTPPRRRRLCVGSASPGRRRTLLRRRWPGDRRQRRRAT